MKAGEMTEDEQITMSVGRDYRSALDEYDYRSALDEYDYRSAVDEYDYRSASNTQDEYVLFKGDVVIDRVEISRAVAKAIAYKQCGRHGEAEAWGREVVRLLECAAILRPARSGLWATRRMDRHDNRFWVIISTVLVMVAAASVALAISPYYAG